MNLRFMDNPFGKMDVKSFSETDLDAVIFTRYRDGNKSLSPIAEVYLTRYYADGNPSVRLYISELSVNDMLPYILCNLTELTSSLYALLRSPKNESLSLDYRMHLGQLKDAMWRVYSDKVFGERYMREYGDIFIEKYGRNAVLMGEILCLYAKLTQNYIVSSSQRGISAYEKARMEGEEES